MFARLPRLLVKPCRQLMGQQVAALTTSGGALGNPIMVEEKAGVRKPYTGPLKAAILDWSGTTADAHVIAPAVVFVSVFEKHGCPITMAEARGPMGLRKDLHIAKIMEIPEVAARWEAAKGAKPAQADVDALFKDFVPEQIRVLPKYTKLLPGAAEAVKIMKEEFNLKLGSTTGFTRPMVDVLLADSIPAGYAPDYTVGGDEVENNMGFRPTPFMVQKNMVNLGVWPVESVVKVDDTVTGVGEGVNAGCWAVGVAGLSNYTDIDTIEQWEAMAVDEKVRRVQASREKLYASGAHYVCDTIRELPWVFKDINERMARGETPQGMSSQVRLINETMESTNPPIR